MKKLILLLFPIVALSQNTGINTIKPTATLEVNGNLKIRASLGNVNDTILVIRNNEVLKVPASYYYNIPNVCPNFQRSQSNGYYLLFKSSSSITNPNANLVIGGKNFVSAGTWIANNEYFYSYTNTSGSALNINQTFSVDFNGMICGY